MSSTTHIIGAGLAGLSAGLRIAESGGHVVLYEASPHAGGRCRSFYDKKLQATIDNGNHLILGANRSVLAYLETIGTLEQTITHEQPRFSFIDIRSRRHWHLQPPSRFPGIPWHEWRHLLKFMLPDARKTVADCVPEQTALFTRLVEPMCIAILNTHPREASATLFARMLKTLLMEGRQGWQCHAPANGLSPLLVDPVIARIKAGGGRVETSCAIQKIHHDGKLVTGLGTAKATIAIKAGDGVICATSPAAARNLLPEYVPELQHRPILNAHFLWPQVGKLRETMPFLGVVGGAVEWIFFHEGRLSTTTSAATEWMAQDEDTLARVLWHDVCTALFIPPDTPLPPWRIIREKRATIAATPENLTKLPGPATPLANLRLAGDYLNPHLPATLEAAIASGVESAGWMLHKKN